MLAEPFLLNNAPTQAQLDLATARPVYNSLNLFPAVPNSSQLQLIPLTQQTVWRVASNLQAPAVYLTGVQVERQLPKNMTAYVGLYAIRIQHVIRARDINAPLPGTITTTAPNGVRPNPAMGDIYQFESSGKYHQANFTVGFNSRLNPRISLSGNYTMSKTRNDTDGQGGSLFPVNSYDLTGEFGRASFDVRHRFTLFGTINAPWWKLVFSPFITASSGPPFNITTGRDTNLDRQYNERPTFAALNTYCTAAPTRCKRIDYSSTSSDFIPRNFGQGPGQVTLTVRVSRTFGFGGEANRSASSQQKNQKTTADNSKTGGDRGRGGPSMMGGMGGAAKVGGGGPGGGGGEGSGQRMIVMGGPGGASAPSKYTLTLSVNFQNVLNHVNFGNPVGNLSSPNFGQSLGLAGSFGGFGGFGGGSTGAGNRRIYLNARFNF